MRNRCLLLATVLLLAGCGGGHEASSTTSSHAATSTSVLTIAPAERATCALAVAHLRRVTVAIRASSELIARSSNKKELTRRIAIEEVQLRRSARLVASGPVPAALVPAVGELASALRAFSEDFARAGVPAARGDFQAASSAMTDGAVVKRIIRASKAIEDAC